MAEPVGAGTTFLRECSFGVTICGRILHALDLKPAERIIATLA
jgi:hypothetical protein